MFVFVVSLSENLSVCVFVARSLCMSGFLCSSGCVCVFREGGVLSERFFCLPVSACLSIWYASTVFCACIILIPFSIAGARSGVFSASRSEIFLHLHSALRPFFKKKQCSWLRE